MISDENAKKAIDNLMHRDMKSDNPHLIINERPDKIIIYDPNNKLHINYIYNLYNHIVNYRNLSVKCDTYLYITKSTTVKSLKGCTGTDGKINKPRQHIILKYYKSADKKIETEIGIFLSQNLDENIIATLNNMKLSGYKPETYPFYLLYMKALYYFNYYKTVGILTPLVYVIINYIPDHPQPTTNSHKSYNKYIKYKNKYIKLKEQLSVYSYNAGVL